MFSQLNPESSAHRRILIASLTAHGLFLIWLLHSPEPPLLTLTSVALGHDGKVLTRVYFPSQTPDDSKTSSPDDAREVYRHQRLGHKKLTWKLTPAAPKLPAPPLSLAPNEAEDKSQTATLSKLGHGATAGPLYGSLPGGPVYGNEIRPALPVETSDPVVYPWERPDEEGKVVIEITIDERGTITGEKVLQSMGTEIDKKCLAALEKWRFEPATKNGVPIASKQDAIFPFKPRGVSANWRGLMRLPYPAIMEL
jgi:TonB family protein